MPCRAMEPLAPFVGRSPSEAAVSVRGDEQNTCQAVVDQVGARLIPGRSGLLVATLISKTLPVIVWCPSRKW